MNYSLLAPEILATAVGMLVLILGLIFKDRARQSVGIISLLSLVAVLILVILRFTDTQVFFNGIYQVDTYANFFKALFALAAVLVILNSSQYMERFGNKKSEFYALMMFATVGMMVMASAGDLLTIYIGLELMTVSFYILTAYLLEDETSSEAGLKYLILGAISSAVLLFGMSLVFALSGTTVITQIAGQISREPALIAGVILIAAGFAFKIAAVPFHMWAPDIYQGAPTPITTYLAVGSKAAGFAALLRIFIFAIPLTQFNWSLVLAILAALTMVVGNLIALTQTNVKRMLAYSSIAQAGYILAGLAAANQYGLKGVLFYAMLYVFSNTGAFAVATAVEVNTGSTDRDAFNALGQRSPMLAAVMTICLLSLAGIPPMAGFAGKFYLFSGAIQAGYLWLAFIGLLMSMISVYYYLLVAKAMYIGSNPQTGAMTVKAPARLALWVCLLATILIGVYPALLSNWAQTAISIFM
ncbi:NAD(P)H-quinone oxidoreductase, subunit N/subunit 2 [Syntrophomonas zehnderi OL-4]|uniref:NADH-quinone oxidoreductase subunit N n=1 Tax=Syntrophomonas zehnderi OL-4 TaxID=690567 RepID=A0A0E4C866_9FIRM|nr:NADH-quinone oxidoreductase subunit N [Syntrophomonas zehnderi]CFX29151.1 NAD(P)H-quinone oxidoreductase, subunit N/subunit 2 [Syntrophomonas zehnderi OL-4]